MLQDERNNRQRRGFDVQEGTKKRDKDTTSMLKMIQKPTEDHDVDRSSLARLEISPPPHRLLLLPVNPMGTT